MSATDTYPQPLDEAALAATWEQAWLLLGCSAPAGLQDELMAAWSQPHRCFHDQRHLRECLALWTLWRDQCSRPGEVAIALWFHDAVYDPQAPRSASNELSSAAWAARMLIRAGANEEAAQRVHDLILATRHPKPQEAPAPVGPSRDIQLLVDIDLSILGSPAARFERYDQDVRREYAWVPKQRYREARSEVLQGFLDRPRLYHGARAAALLEAQARINLSAALLGLAQ